MIPVAAIVLLIPFFFASVFLERMVFRRFCTSSPELARRWSWVANGASYCFMLAGLVVVLIVALVQGNRPGIDVLTAAGESGGEAVEVLEMSRDLVFWKQRPGVSTTRGAVALSLGECDIEGLEALDDTRLIRAIDDRFPGWKDTRCEHWKFECEVHSTHVALSTYGGTPAEVEEWFWALARREGLTGFDFETDEITAEDKRAHRRIVAAARKELEADEREEERHEFQRLLRLAEQGDAAAQFAVGQKFSFGEGVSRDPASAASWYERAAVAGNVDAMVNLAGLYRNGRGVARDPAKAVVWLERAVQQDGLFAAFELAQMYAAGEGVPKSSERAEHLFQTALGNGHPEARKALRLLGESRRDRNGA
jgi:hypothetical protein